MARSNSLFKSGPGSTQGNRHLVEIRAGKMNLNGTTVSADKRKGRIFVYRNDEHLMHFCWQDRITSVIEDDLIIFPDDCDYIRVPQCTTGRVYLLKFRTTPRRYFFWLQEPRTDKDEEHCRRINQLLNNSPTLHSQDSDLQYLLSSPHLLQYLTNRASQVNTLASILGTIRAPRNSTTTNPPPTRSDSSTNPTTTLTSSKASSTSLSSDSDNSVDGNVNNKNKKDLKKKVDDKKDDNKNNKKKGSK